MEPHRLTILKNDEKEDPRTLLIKVSKIIEDVRKILCPIGI